MVSNIDPDRKSCMDDLRDRGEEHIPMLSAAIGNDATREVP